MECLIAYFDLLVMAKDSILGYDRAIYNHCVDVELKCLNIVALNDYLLGFTIASSVLEERG